jgi:hypothetical protein
MFFAVLVEPWQFHRSRPRSLNPNRLRDCLETFSLTREIYRFPSSEFTPNPAVTDEAGLVA